VCFLPVDNEICVESTALPGDFHKDPATGSSWRRRASLPRPCSRRTRRFAPIRTYGPFGKASTVQAASVKSRASTGCGNSTDMNRAAGYR
jgi:hypothetical protein